VASPWHTSGPGGYVGERGRRDRYMWRWPVKSRQMGECGETARAAICRLRSPQHHRGRFWL